MRGSISIRADNTWGVTCNQCHHLIRNSGVSYEDDMEFICDRCNTRNMINKSNIPQNIQHKEYKDLWKSKQVSHREG